MSAITPEGLRDLVARLERLEEERARIDEDIGEVLRVAEAGGYHVPALRSVREWRASTALDKRGRDAFLGYLLMLERP